MGSLVLLHEHGGNMRCLSSRGQQRYRVKRLLGLVKMAFKIKHNIEKMQEINFVYETLQTAVCYEKVCTF